MAKEIISVKVKVGKVDLAKDKTDLLAVGVFSDVKKPAYGMAGFDKKSGGAISKVSKSGDFTAKADSSVLLYGDDKAAARLLLVGLGEKKKATADTVRNAAALAASKAVELKAKKAILAVHAGVKGDIARIGQAIAEGIYCGSYRYDEFVTKTENGRAKSLAVTIADSGDKGLAKAVKAGAIIGKAQCFTRTVANRPGNVINPPTLAAAANRMAGQTQGLSCSVFDEKQLKAKKMGGILAVGAGSASKPRMIVLKYAPKDAGKKPVIGLVGKAVTFDSGGISIKPSKGMQDMKLDMSGGAAVLGAMKAIAEIKPKVTVYGIIPSAENVLGPASYRPGDIITTYSGKTVEVQNTDAEGRMILCDAIAYAVKCKCDAIVDIATLTGACKVALGCYKAGVMGNNDGLVKALEKASQVSGESIWHMPSGDEYLGEMKSKIADLKNIGNGWGGACSAAAFLGQFAGKTKWAHIDMAGVDMFEGSNAKYGAVGATGFGVRLLTEYACGVK
jgi:leucyl aminopeptidase